MTMSLNVYTKYETNIIKINYYLYYYYYINIVNLIIHNINLN